MQRERFDPELEDHLANALRQLAAGSGWEVEQRELHQAFVHGLESWARGLLFPNVLPVYFVAEALHSPAGDPAAVPRLVRSTDGFDSDAGRAAPVAEESVLLAVADNTVQIRALTELPGRVGIVVPLARPLAEQLERLAPALQPLELDLYCDADRHSTLNAFHTLLQGRWPQEIGLPADTRDVWPRLGLRPVWQRRRPRLSPGPVDILNLTHHPLEERFGRVPLAPLVRFERGPAQQRELVVPVDIGRDAERIVRELSGCLKVNHLAFWNYHIGLADSPMHFAFEVVPPGTTRVTVRLDQPAAAQAVLVLECWTRDRGRSFEDRRWASWIDPLSCFDLEVADAHELRLHFAAGSLDPAHLFLTYLIAVQWSMAAVGTNLVVRTGFPPRPSFRVRRVFAPDALDAAAFRQQQQRLLATWLAAGRSCFPGAPIVTRDDLTGAVWRWLPEPVRERLRGTDQTDLAPRLRVRSIFRAEAPGYPVTTVELPDPSRSDPPAALQYYLEWLARTLEARCPAGTLLEIRLTPTGG